MSNLTASERYRLEKLFDMSEGYVLNFTDRSFRDFFNGHNVEIDAERYRKGGHSKAKRMRTFWEIENNHIIGSVINDLIIYGIYEKCFSNSDASLIDDCRQIAQRLLQYQPVVTEQDALIAIDNERDFEVVAEHIKEAIEKNQPEEALDRLHTYVIKFMRVTCEPYGIEIEPNIPLHTVFSMYVKKLRNNGHLESEITDRILKSSISVLEKFNDVRNNQSLAHDNPILNYEESRLIFNHIAASIRFITSLENKIKAKMAEVKTTSAEDDDIPF